MNSHVLIVFGVLYGVLGTAGNSEPYVAAGAVLFGIAAAVSVGKK